MLLCLAARGETRENRPGCHDAQGRLFSFSRLTWVQICTQVGAAVPGHFRHALLAPAESFHVVAAEESRTAVFRP